MVGVTSCRIISCLQVLIGWSSRSAVFTEDNAKGRREMRRLQEDQINFNYFEGLVGDVEGCKHLVSRGVLNTMRVL